jgi:hypothetical protein
VKRKNNYAVQVKGCKNMISILPFPAAAVSNPANLEVAAGLFLIVLLITKEMARAVTHNPASKVLSGILQLVNQSLYLLMVPQFLVFVIIISIKIYHVLY